MNNDGSLPGRINTLFDFWFPTRRAERRLLLCPPGITVCKVKGICTYSYNYVLVLYTIFRDLYTFLISYTSYTFCRL